MKFIVKKQQLLFKLLFSFPLLAIVATTSCNWVETANKETSILEREKLKRKYLAIFNNLRFKDQFKENINLAEIISLGSLNEKLETEIVLPEATNLYILSSDISEDLNYVNFKLQLNDRHYFKRDAFQFYTKVLLKNGSAFNSQLNPEDALAKSAMENENFTKFLKSIPETLEIKNEYRDLNWNETINTKEVVNFLLVQPLAIPETVQVNLKVKDFKSPNKAAANLEIIYKDGTWDQELDLVGLESPQTQALKALKAKIETLNSEENPLVTSLDHTHLKALTKTSNPDLTLVHENLSFKKLWTENEALQLTWDKNYNVDEKGLFHLKLSLKADKAETQKLKVYAKLNGQDTIRDEFSEYYLRLKQLSSAQQPLIYKMMRNSWADLMDRNLNDDFFNQLIVKFSHLETLFPQFPSPDYEIEIKEVNYQNQIVALKVELRKNQFQKELMLYWKSYSQLETEELAIINAFLETLKLDQKKDVKENTTFDTLKVIDNYHNLLKILKDENLATNKALKIDVLKVETKENQEATISLVAKSKHFYQNFKMQLAGFSNQESNQIEEPEKSSDKINESILEMGAQAATETLIEETVTEELVETITEETEESAVSTEITNEIEAEELKAEEVKTEELKAEEVNKVTETEEKEKSEETPLHEANINNAQGAPHFELEIDSTSEQSLKQIANFLKLYLKENNQSSQIVKLSDSARSLFIDNFWYYSAEPTKTFYKYANLEKEINFADLQIFTKSWRIDQGWAKQLATFKFKAKNIKINKASKAGKLVIDYNIYVDNKALGWNDHNLNLKKTQIIEIARPGSNLVNKLNFSVSAPSGWNYDALYAVDRNWDSSYYWYKERSSHDIKYTINFDSQQRDYLNILKLFFFTHPSYYTEAKGFEILVTYEDDSKYLIPGNKELAWERWYETRSVDLIELRSYRLNDLNKDSIKKVKKIEITFKKEFHPWYVSILELEILNLKYPQA